MGNSGPFFNWAMRSLAAPASSEKEGDETPKREFSKITHTGGQSFQSDHQHFNWRIDRRLGTFQASDDAGSELRGDDEFDHVPDNHVPLVGDFNQIG